MLYDLSTLFVIRPEIAASDLPDGLALLDLQAGKYFSLNMVGAEIWRAMQLPVALREIIDRVCMNFDVEPDICQADILSLLASLDAAGLVEVSTVEPAS